MDNLVCVDDFKAEAKKVLGSNTWGYLEKGADEEFVLQQSRLSFKRWIVRPRFLRDVSTRDMSTSIFGKSIPFPVGVAPMAMQQLAHPDGELATAKAAESLGCIYILSTMSTFSIEEVAEAAPLARKWFQLYFQKDREVSADLIHRAEKSGYEAIVLTLDTQMIGKRRSNLRSPVKLGPNMRLANFVTPAGEDPSKTVAKMRDNSKPLRDQALTWDAIKWIRGKTTMRLILKGILTSEDSLLAVEYGVDGLIVSNHGGRQLDCVLPPIECLSEVVKAVNGKCEVYMDGGVNFGSDVFKAIALGAKMVFVGRGVLWGLAVGGEEGAKTVLQILRGELELTMGLSGISRIEEINPDFVARYTPLQ